MGKKFTSTEVALCSLLALFTTATASKAKAAFIHPSLLKDGGGDDQQPEPLVIIHFDSRMDPVYDSIQNTKFTSLAEKRTALTLAQQVYTQQTQKYLQALLTSLDVQYESFWINNKMVVYNASSSLISTISEFPGVAGIDVEPVAKMVPFQVNQINLNLNLTRGASLAPQRTTTPQLLWHMKEIRTELVWEQGYRGQGVVIASIDSGVRWSHEALWKGWRRDYGWFDSVNGSATPNDDHGHGTHTIGTVSGRNGIGVAPESTWIACKACDQDIACRGIDLWRCGQWAQCPHKANGTEQDCSYAPDIIINSWGSTEPGTWYDEILRSWSVAEIIPVFSAGNTGPNCSSLWYPGDMDGVISVGATTPRGQLWHYSSVGPSRIGEAPVKPDVVAPGQWIHSAWPTTDYHYATYSGTSMAAPHVAGLVALMKSKRPSLTYQQIYDILTETAETEFGVDTTTSMKQISCSFRSDSRKSHVEFPNNAWGFGRVDALRALNGIPE